MKLHVIYRLQITYNKKMNKTKTPCAFLHRAREVNKMLEEIEHASSQETQKTFVEPTTGLKFTEDTELIRSYDKITVNLLVSPDKQNIAIVESKFNNRVYMNVPGILLFKSLYLVEKYLVRLFEKTKRNKSKTTKTMARRNVKVSILTKYYIVDKDKLKTKLYKYIYAKK